MLIRPMMFRAPAGGGPSGPTTWNPADKGASCTLSNGNLTATAGSGYGATRSTRSKASGKWFFEVNFDLNGTQIAFGVANAMASIESGPGGSDDNGVGYYKNGDVYRNGALLYSGPALSQGDTIGVAVDLAARRVWFAKTGSWTQGSPAAGAGGVAAPSGDLFAMFAPANGASGTAAFLAASLSNSPPSGFTAWG